MWLWKPVATRVRPRLRTTPMAFEILKNIGNSGVLLWCFPQLLSKTDAVSGFPAGDEP
jgi:hypothetical protein